MCGNFKQVKYKGFRSGVNQSFLVHAQSLSCVHLFVTPLTKAHRGPLSTEFSRQIQEWVATSSSRDLPNLGLEPMSPELTGVFFIIEPPEKPLVLLKR